MDERDRGQGSLSDKVKGSYRRVSVVMYVTLVIAAIAVFAAAYVPKQFSLAYTILVLMYSTIPLMQPHVSVCKIRAISTAA